MANIEKVKVLVIGDSGVGKTSLTHLISHNEPISNPSWTVGCSVEVKLHQFREGTPMQKSYFVELWDIGGSSSHKNTRSVFYDPFHGIIFVHDLTNRKSLQNFNPWIAEVMNKESGKGKPVYDEFDVETFAGTSQFPLLMIGTKLDQAHKIRLQNKAKGQTCYDIAQDWGTDSIDMDCHDSSSLAPGTSSAVKLSRFFDKVIEMRYYKKDYVNPTSNHPDKRRFPAPLTKPLPYV